ncbi:MAG: isoprenylcysteine carboxylmethyltransferase family protein [Planctomycetes bacterium]|nr:isoprenylcysteine carboxylmethyltransferase family protein [Planctomycetota bacterium]
MHDEDVYRLILILGFAAVCPFGLYHRLKSQATGEKLDRRQEGLFILLTLRPIAAARMVGVLLYVFDPAWMAWSSMGLPGWLRWGGVGVGVVAAVLLIVVFHTLGTNITDTVVTRANHTLVTRGPYRWVRHPFYVAFALAVLADSLVTANWFLALTGGLTVTLIALRTKTEEEKLIDRFGDEYRNYMHRTGRFMPRRRRAD